MSGASGRSSGVSADTLTDTFARGSGPLPSCSSIGRAGQRAGRRRSRGAPGAAGGVAVGLGGGDRRLAEQVDRAGHAPTPQAPEHAERAGRGLADDEPVGHVPDAAGGRRPERGAAGPVPGSASPPRSGAGLGHLGQEAGQMAGDVVERPAGGHDVDEPEQRGAQLLVARGELHRPGVERAHGMAGGRGECGGQLGADPADLGLDRVAVALTRGLPRDGARGGSVSGGVARSIASQLVSRARSASSAAPPPRSPNRRLANSR